MLKNLPEHCTTRDVALALGLAVRSVQLMVDRGELQAWKTPGGHRRIARDSVWNWMQQRQKRTEKSGEPSAPATTVAPSAWSPTAHNALAPASAAYRPKVLLIEDSAHFQNLVRLLLAHDFPHLELHVAEDGIVGLAMAGELHPEVMLVDILLPGVDGATLVGRLRTHPRFQSSHLIVVTSLDETQRGPYAFALEGLPIVHKPRLLHDLPLELTRYLQLQLPTPTP